MQQIGDSITLIIENSFSCIAIRLRSLLKVLTVFSSVLCEWVNNSRIGTNEAQRR